MKNRKRIIYALAMTCLLGVFFVACKDDELPEAPRLFRPVVTMLNKGNDIHVEWINIKGAESYELELYKATGGKDENEEDIYAPYRKEVTDSSPHVFEDVEWDEKYKLEIKAISASENTASSEIYETKSISVLYITRLNSVLPIDVAARLTWKTEGENPFTAFVLKDEDNDEVVETINLTEEEFLKGTMDILDLEPTTNYRLLAYSGEVQTGDTYEGRIRFATRETEDYDEMYGAGRYIDLRNRPDDKDDILINWYEWITTYDAIILKGGAEYNVSKDIAFTGGVIFRTALSLEGNAMFIHDSGLLAENDLMGAKLTFEKIDFISDKAYEQRINPENTELNTDKSFGGRQVYNANNTYSKLDELTFNECTFEGFRAIVRLQGEDGIEKLTFNNCSFNGVGDQAVVTTNNQEVATLGEVMINNCTFYNIVMLTDLRSSSAPVKFTVDNSTFCYAPMETKVNANTPLFRIGKNEVTLSVKNTVFGPSMATPGANGAALQTFVAGKAGSIFLNIDALAPKANISVMNSYKTDFEWTEFEGKAKDTYALSDLSDLKINEKSLFLNPGIGNFSVISNALPSDVGAEKWRMK